MQFHRCLNSIIQEQKGSGNPNEFGGNGNLEAIAFIKDLNETIYRDFPDVQTIAEEQRIGQAYRSQLLWVVLVWNEVDDGMDARHA
jgi:hypothetical protein